MQEIQDQNEKNIKISKDIEMEEKPTQIIDHDHESDDLKEKIRMPKTPKKMILIISVLLLAGTILFLIGKLNFRA